MAHSLEVREWAIRILGADTLEEKLLTPISLTDHNPGPSMIWNEPSRPSNMQFTKRQKKEKLPPFHAHHKKENRAICLHRFAGHELLAVEIMAYALLRFPEAPYAFRKGIIHTLKEEQEHVRLYMKRMEEMDISFGDLPFYRHFWVHTPYLRTPIEYVSVMNLTFEMANLDFAPMYGSSFLKYGDKKSAELMNRILHDEISHVSLGWRWLKKLKAEKDSEWDVWKNSLTPFLTPKRAKGFIFHEEYRKQAGISSQWLKEFKKSLSYRY